MIKSSSSTSDSGCLPVSSNCVVWQGPCLDCIDLKTGDTVSTVVENMATELCKIQDQLNLTSLDLDCLFEVCASCPTPDKKLSSVLGMLISKVCSLDTRTSTGSTTIPPTTDSVVVASCFQTTDLNGDMVTNLSQLDYLRAIGIKLCSISTTVNSHSVTLANHETRLTAVENSSSVEPEALTVTPLCVLPGASPEPIQDVVEALEEQFCQLRAITGTPTDLSQSIGRQCTNLNTSQALSVNSNMSALTGWKPTVSTVADSLNNMWLAICDIRTALAALKTTAGTSCNDVKVNFLASITENGAAINLYFSGYTTIPAGFTNCAAQGSKLTITDGMGGSHVMYVDVVSQANNPTPLRIELNTTPLTPSGMFTFSLESCVTNGTLTCNKTVEVKATGNAQSCASPSITSVTLN